MVSELHISAYGRMSNLYFAEQINIGITARHIGMVVELTISAYEHVGKQYFAKYTNIGIRHGILA